MMYLYDSYCYADLNLAAQSFFSQGVVHGFGVLQSYTIISSNTVQYSFIFNPTTTLTSINTSLISYSTASFDYTFQECFRTGFDNSFFGLELNDIYLITSGMIGILITAGLARLASKTIRA